MRAGVIATAAAAAGILWVGLSAQQEMPSKPGPGSGITRVVGEVKIADTANVRVVGEVKLANPANVRVVDMPPISVANPSFVRKGSRYVVTWNDGGTETINVVDVAQDGWVEVEARRSRWVNLRAARAVENER
jgi:hypothetical protein